MKRLALLVLISSLLGCATTQKYIGHIGQTSDSITTAIALYGSEMVEGNPILSPLMDSPLGHIGVWLVKMGIFWVVPYMPDQHCTVAYQAASGLGWGAAINNLTILLGAIQPLPLILAAGGAIYSAWISYDGAQDWCNVKAS